MILVLVGVFWSSILKSGSILYSEHWRPPDLLIIYIYTYIYIYMGNWIVILVIIETDK